MSSLGLTLLILIVVAIGGLALFNYWSQRNNGTRELDDAIADASEPGDRTEPSLGFDDEPIRATSSQGPAPGFDLPSARDAPATAPDFTADPDQSPQSSALPEWARDGDDSGDAPTSRSSARQSSAADIEPDWTTSNSRADERADTPPPDMQTWLASARRDLAQADDDSTTTPDGSSQAESFAPAGVSGFDEPALGAGTIPDPASDSHDVGEHADDKAQSGHNSGDDAVRSDAQPPAAVEGGEPDKSAGSGLGSASANPVEAAGDEPSDPSVGSGPVSGPGSTEPVDAATAESGTQAANDFFTTVNLDLPEPVSGQKLLSVTKGFSAVGSKPVWISAGQRLDPTTVRTSMISSDQSYALLRFDLLQVNRQGPLTGVEYSDFVRRISDIADELGVLANTPDMNIVLIRSRVMDAEVASLDAQVAINVEADDPITDDQYTDCANEIGLRRGSSGICFGKDESGHVLYTVSHEPGSNRIVLVLDVPRVPADLQPIRKVVECAWKIAQGVHGKMIDDSGRAINNALFERIESQIATHYRALEAAGLPAGAELTRYVYNVEHDLAQPSPNSES